MLLLQSCGQPAASIPASTRRPCWSPRAALAGRVLARCHATQPPPGSKHRQGCDQKRSSSSCWSGASGCTP